MNKTTILVILGIFLVSSTVIFFFSWPCISTAVIDRWGPYSSATEICLFCGKIRRTKTQCDKLVFVKEPGNKTSDWIESLYPDHKVHQYDVVCCEGRSKWFDYVVCGDGGNGPGFIGELHSLGYEEEAKEWLKKWHTALKLPNDDMRSTLTDIQNSLRDIVVAIREEKNPALLQHNTETYPHN